MMMSIQELIQEHVEEKRKYCNNKKCSGIKVTFDNRTVCDESNSR